MPIGRDIPGGGGGGRVVVSGALVAGVVFFGALLLAHETSESAKPNSPRIGRRIRTGKLPAEVSSVRHRRISMAACRSTERCFAARWRPGRSS